MGIILWLIFGALAGWIASMIMGTNRSQGLLLDIVAEHDRNEGDDAFGECSAERGENCPDGVLRDARLMTDPLHTVNEVLAGPVHETGGDQQ